MSVQFALLLVTASLDGLFDHPASRRGGSYNF